MHNALKEEKATCKVALRITKGLRGTWMVSCSRPTLPPYTETTCKVASKLLSDLLQTIRWIVCLVNEMMQNIFKNILLA
jgi:hypothetical protein